MNSRKPIHTVQNFVDYIHHATVGKEQLNVPALLTLLHKKIVATMRTGEPVHDDVFIVYFKFSQLITGLWVTRHRVIATIDGIKDWYESSH